MNEILQNQTEIFMDVQDLVLQWVFYRSFEFRPEITTYFIQFLSELLKKYAGAALLVDAEKTLIISSAFQLYLTCNKYVDPSYFSQLFQLVLAQTGCVSFISVLEWHVRENKIIEEFHMEQILDAGLIIIKYLQPLDVAKIGQFIQILKDYCYANMTQSGNTVKALQILATCYQKNPELIIRAFPSKDDKVLAAVKRLIEYPVNSADVSPSALSKNYSSKKISIQPTKNEVVEVPEHDADEGSHNGSQDGSKVSGNVDQNFMILKGQIDSFLNNFLRADDSLCLKYLQIVHEWLAEPRMKSLLVANANDIVGNLVKYFQRICAKVDVQKLNTYQIVLNTIKTVVSNKEILSGLSETATFELFDTLLFILVSANETKAGFKEGSEKYQGLTEMASLLNGTILGIIANADLNQLYQTLFDLLIKCRSEYVPDKFDGLIVKCIVKTTARFEQNGAQDLDLENLFMKMHYYMVLIKVKKVDRKEDDGVKVVKTVLNNIINSFPEARILEAYNGTSINEAEDNNMKKWIYTILQMKKGKPADPVARGISQHDVTKLRRKESGVAQSANINNRRHPEIYQEPEDEDPEIDENEAKIGQIAEITNKLKQKGLHVSQLPKILKELTQVLKTIDEEVDIEPFVRGLEDKARNYILREVKNFYSGHRGNDFSESKLSNSEYRSNRKPSHERSVDGITREKPSPMTQSLRPTASSHQIGNHPNTTYQKQTTGGGTPSGKMAQSMRIPAAPVDEHALKIDEIRKRMGFTR